MGWNMGYELGEGTRSVEERRPSRCRASLQDPLNILAWLSRSLAEGVRGLNIWDAAKAPLLALTPATYTGLTYADVHALGRT